MAGVTVTVDGSNITAYVDLFSIELESEATRLVGLARFTVRDHTGTVSIAAKDSVVIAAGGSTLFRGEVVEQAPRADGVAVEWRVSCQDSNILLDEAAVEGERYFASMADSAIIDDLFSTYSNIDGETYVETIDASMEAQAFSAMTLREIMDTICAQTGGRYYVDSDLRLHYFTSEANEAAFGLSTSPDGLTMFGLGDFEQMESASRIVNKVFVQGNGVSGWEEDTDSIAVYGERQGVSRDQRITTVQGVQDRGNAILEQYAWPRNTYTCWTEKDGLTAGQEIAIEHETLGIDDSFYIRSITTQFLGKGGDKRRYHLVLNDEPITPAAARQSVGLRVMALETVVNDVNGTVYDTDAPAAPVLVAGNLATGVDLDADGHQIVYVNCTWGEVGDEDLDHYDVQVGTAADLSGYTITRVHAAGGSRQEQFRGLPGNTLHYVRVRAVDWVGNASAWSDIQSITTAKDASAPAQVAGLNVTASRTLMGLNWSANSEADLLEYEIQRAAAAGGPWTTIATARLNFYIDQDFSDAQIAAEGTWYYKVRAVDTSGNAGDYSAVDSDALSRIKADHIAALTITGDKIFGNTITADKMNVATLSAISANLGTITAGTVTGATIRTAASGARIVLDSTNGIQAFNAGGTQTVSILPSGAGWIGTAASIAWNTAGGLTVDGGVLVDGTVVATAFSNVIGQPLFSAADGLALWGPGCETSASTWLSTRGQVATVSGAFHQESGQWPGTRALVVEPGTTNLVENASAGVNVTDYWSVTGGTRARSTTYYKFDKASFQVTSNGTAGGPYLYKVDAVASPAQGEAFSLSAWVRSSPDTEGQTAYVRIVETGGASPTTSTTTSVTLTQSWQLIAVTHTIVQADRTGILIIVRCTDGISGHAFYADGIQLEAGYPTTTAIGSMDHCSWTGAEHNSSTLRIGTAVAAPFQGTINAAKGAVVMNFRQFRHGGDFSTFLFTLGDAVGEMDAYISTAGGLVYRINGASRCTVAGVAAGVEHQLMCTWDVGADSSQLILDGVLVSTGTCGGAAWTPGATIYFGGVAGTAYAITGTVSQFASFAEVPTVGQAAAMYHSGAPLMDAGAVDVPGAYFQDGRFRLWSSRTGARTEIDVEGIKARSAAAQTVWIKTSGDVLFGSNVAAPASTALAVFAAAQTYNTEALGAGDVLFGDNSAGKANLLWDVSDGLLRFRGGTTTQIYISTDGSFRAGGGAIKISAAANILFSVASANQGLSWFSDTGFSTVSGYINVATSTGVMTIATGGPSWGTAPDMRFDFLNSTGGGTTWTAIYIDASDKEVRINGGSGGSLSTRNNGDGDWPALYAQQVSNDRAVAHFDQDHATAPIIRLDGPWDAATEKTLGGYFKVNINGTNRWVPYYT